MQKVNSKLFLLLLGILLPVICYKVSASCSLDGLHPIQTKEAHVASIPKGHTIQASIDGHWLTVTFTQDIGTLTMELDKVSGPMIFSYPSVQTPDSYQFYLPLTGDYIITFILANGDEYYGEFTVTD
jgi:hypothetical protein